MKIENKDRIEDSLALQKEGSDFDTQLAEAKASGKRFSIDVLPDGRKAVTYFTDEEAAYMATFHTPPRKKPWRVELDALRAELEALKKK